MIPANGCYLFGAYRIFSGITDGVTLLHSTIGCNWGTLAHHITSNQSDIRQACSVILDKDIVFSGEEVLQEALEQAVKLYDCKIIFVLTGCVAEIIGDDIKTTVNSFRDKKKILYLDSAGFKGNMNEGYENALIKLFSLMKEPERKREKSINIIGVSIDDPKIDADINEIKRMLNGKVEINTILASCTLEELERASEAESNIVFNRGVGLAELMKDKYDIPYINVDYPYGLEGSKNFLNILEDSLKINLEEEKKLLENETLPLIKKTYQYLQHIYGLPVALIGDNVRATGLKKFLINELGLEIEVFNKYEELEDLAEFYDQVRNSNAVMVFGSTYEKKITDELNIPLIRYTYPVIDSISISDRPYVGAKGTINIIEDIINSLLIHTQKKDGLYR